MRELTIYEWYLLTPEEREAYTLAKEEEEMINPDLIGGDDLPF